MRQEKDGLGASLRQFLDTNCQQILSEDGEAHRQHFLEQLETLLQSDDVTVRSITLRWVIDDFIKHHHLPVSLRGTVFHMIRPITDPWLAQPLVEWLELSDNPYKKELLLWLSELNYTSALEREPVLRALFAQFLSDKESESIIVDALKRLDTPLGEATNIVLNSFPTKTFEQNQRIITLLGQLGRYRAVKPLIAFAQEFPEYLRSVMKALSKLDYDDVDQFYIRCLSKEYRSQPMVLIEAIKQIRKRRLRKASPLLDELFPMEESAASLINRAINGEIALTMASFGAYAWAREKLLADVMLNGINQKYLKAIDRLRLEEAVPLLKAILLMPETPELLALQHQAYQICERLLTGQKR